jgi:pyruvate,water dikinase
MAFADLLTGIARPTATMRENSDLWKLTDRIRKEPKLRQLVDSHQGRAFFEQLPNSPEGQEFARHYQDFLDAHGHRGAADRDLYFDRRREDPGIDYDAIRALLSAGDDADPKAKHQAVSARRQEVIDEVTANIRSKPLGGLKTEACKVVLAYVHEFLVFRDDERYFSDRLTWAAKKALLEMNRRLSERGQVNSDRDFYFLGHDELFDLFERRANPTWTAAKIAGRMTNFDRFAAKEWAPPMYIQDDKPLALIEDSPDETSMTGMPTSRGVVTGTARVVRSLNEIGSVREGDILITNSTDPGWTPVFMVLKGIVLETGGMLAHGSCLAREYGLPAIQLDRAMARIPNGATITLDGESGTVLIDADPE